MHYANVYEWSQQNDQWRFYATSNEIIDLMLESQLDLKNKYLISLQTKYLNQIVNPTK